MQHSTFDQALALAGIFQTASLVKQIANKGMANSATIDSSIESLFRFDAASTEDVYGGQSGISHGVKVLRDHLSTVRGGRDIEITQYVLSLIVLEKKLSGNKKMLDKLQDGLQEIEQQLELFNLNDNTNYSKIGNLYQNTISQLGPKIIVKGEQSHLSNEMNACKIRSLLLAGIRSAVLWKQCGGSRLHILFKRKQYLQECEKIIARS